jgi:hypothetical protein
MRRGKPVESIAFFKVFKEGGSEISRNRRNLGRDEANIFY